jgi:hypothetical protein
MESTSDLHPERSGSGSVLLGPPVKTSLVGGNKVVKPIQGVGGVTGPTPHLITWTPTTAGVREVGAEQARHLRVVDPTHDALPCPGPEGRHGS